MFITPIEWEGKPEGGESENDDTYGLVTIVHPQHYQQKFKSRNKPNIVACNILFYFKY